MPRKSARTLDAAGSTCQDGQRGGGLLGSCCALACPDNRSQRGCPRPSKPLHLSDLCATITLVGWERYWAATHPVRIVELVNEHSLGGRRYHYPSEMTMDFFLGMILCVLTGTTRTWLAAAEAFGAPPRNRIARRCRTVALLLLLATSCLFLSAALVFTVAERPMVGEVLGWSGVACFHLCVACGICYPVVNRVSVT